MSEKGLKSLKVCRVYHYANRFQHIVGENPGLSHHLSGIINKASQDPHEMEQP